MMKLTDRCYQAGIKNYHDSRFQPTEKELEK